jgi:hypothetical protein
MKFQQVLVGWANQGSETGDGLVAKHYILQNTCYAHSTPAFGKFPPRPSPQLQCTEAQHLERE